VLAAADANGQVDVVDELVVAEAVAEPESANGAAADEKPKTPSRRRAPRIHVPGDPDATPVAPEVVQEAVGDVPLDTEPDEPDADSDETPDATDDGEAPVVKRKTRRGSRGGKNRRKKPAAEGDAAEADGEADAGVAVAVVDDADAPADDDAETENETAELVPEVATVAEIVVDIEPEPAAEPDEPAVSDEESPGYVPMSEWLDDFDRR